MGSEQPVMPLDRPSARVILVDGDGRVLLFRMLDPRDDKPAVWSTPGGGIEAGETPVAAAARELAEETGLEVDPGELGAPVAVTRGEWVFRGRKLYSEDWFFFHRTAESFEPDSSNWTELEREVHTASRWWTPAELDELDEPILPCGLADLVRSVMDGSAGTEPVELPWSNPSI